MTPSRFILIVALPLVGMMALGAGGLFAGLCLSGVVAMRSKKRSKGSRQIAAEYHQFAVPGIPAGSQPTKSTSTWTATPAERGTDPSGFGTVEVALRGSRPRPSGETIPSPPAERIQFSRDTVTAARTPSPKKILWVPPGDSVRLGGRVINGMVYATDMPLGWEGEPSAICYRLPVDAHAHAGDELPYYPNYETLSSAQRAFYLDWLASGRKMTDPDQLPTGYLFLFFYGIERRVLAEGDRSPDLWVEVFRLLQTYGMTRRSRSVPSYFGDFLHFTAYAAGVERYAAALGDLLAMQGERLSETCLALALAQHFRTEQPINWKLAHLVAMGLDDSRRSVVIKRTGEAFREMFATRFQEKYPDGLALKASKRDRTIRYQTGNATLASRFSGSDSENPYVLQVPGVVGIPSQFKALAKIWNQCIEDLSGYSRAVGKLSKESGASALDQLKAYLALPAEIRQGRDHPLDGPYREALASCPEQDGLIFVPVAVLASLVGIDKRDNLTQKQSTELAALVESFDHGLAPDPGLLNLPLAWDQEVAVFRRPESGAITKSLGGLLRLLHLAVLVAAADGVIDDEELEVFHRSSGLTSDLERAHARATEAVLVRDTNVANKRLAKITKSVPETERQAVFELLVHIACSDEVLSSDENRLLRRIAKALKLGASALDDVLAADSSLQTVTVAASERPTAAESSRAPAKAPAFALDMDRISALTAETAEVVSILSRALEEEGDSDSEEPDGEAADIGRRSAAPEWMAELDERYQAALVDMLKRLAEQPLDLDEIADRHHLIADDLVDGVNAWSDEALGDFLLEREDDDRVSIVEDLLPTN